MRKLRGLFVCGLAFVIALAFAVVIAPRARAYGSGGTWQLGFSGTGTLTGLGFGFWGWCVFVGAASGTDGDCQISQYLHFPSGSGNIQCETDFDMTGWHEAPGGFTSVTGKPDFFADSGTVTVNPASAAAACFAFLAPAGIFVTQTGPGTGVFSAPSDLLPAAPGHYNLNGLVTGPITYTQLAIQVAQLPA